MLRYPTTDEMDYTQRDGGSLSDECEQLLIPINQTIENICANRIEDEFDDCTADKVYIREAPSVRERIKEEPCDIDDNVEDSQEDINRAINYVKVKDENIEESTVVVQETVFVSDTEERHNEINSSICCEECGGEYDLYCLKCPMLIRVFDSNIPKRVDNRVRQTLPENILDIRETPSNIGVVALRAIPRGVVFGPFEGLVSTKDEITCKWKLKREKLVYAKDPKRLNWMQYIRYAERASDRNLIPFQHGNQLYYHSDRQINMGDELLVHFDNDAEDVQDNYLKPLVWEKFDSAYACTFCCLGYKSAVHLSKHNFRCPEKRSRTEIAERIIQCAFCKIYLDEKEYTDHHIGPCCTRNAKHDLSAVLTDTSGKFCESPMEICEAGSNSAKANAKNILKKFKCPQCLFETAYKTNLRKHLLFHQGIQPYACEECGKKFTLKTTLNRHFKAKHTEAGRLKFKAFKCLQCPYETDTKKCLIRHSYIHSEEKPFVCRLCKRGFTCQWSLKIHLKHLHPSENAKEYKCEACKYGTNDDKRLETHRKHVHPENGVKEYKCAICGYETNDKGRLNQHLRIHDNVKKFKCGHCQKFFSLKSNLKMHIKAVHDSNKDYRCEKCGYQTNRKDGYDKHLLVHESGIRFWCKMCNLGFDCMANLKQHDKENHEVGADGKKFECKKCGTRFGQKPTLEKHYRTVHAKDKMFKCQACSYESTREDHVRRHASIHQPVKPFVCLTCDAGFASAGSLSTHNKRKHSAIKKEKEETK